MTKRVEILSKWLGLLLVSISACFSMVNAAYAQGPDNFPNCRLGIGGAQNDVVGYDLEQLNLGLYVDWRARNPTPPGLPVSIEYIQIVRVHQNKTGDWDSPYVEPPSYTVSPSLATIAGIAASQTGALWLIGNEIERRDWPNGKQDEITPELYATAFHEIQAAIKAADPTARIAIGGVILGTPLRLKYLDRVWNSYLAQFGYSMGNDIDVWNVHAFILPEVRGTWGMDIPAGLETPQDYLPGEGLFYCAGGSGCDQHVLYFEARDHQLDINYFKKYTEDFRAWMAARGERDKPLYNTEYGPLNDFYGFFDEQDAIQYLTDTFDYMLAATDENTGYPLDENRLVQGWLWYSLNAEWFPLGQLFDPDTQNITVIGNGWKDYVSDPANVLAALPQQNLLAGQLTTVPDPPMAPPGGTTNVTLQFKVANSGNTPTNTGNSIAVSFWDGIPTDPDSAQIGSTQIINDIPGCGRFITVETVWPSRAVGEHTWYAQVAPISGETSLDDNIASHTFTVVEGVPGADVKLFLPLILKSKSS